MSMTREREREREREHGRTNGPTASQTDRHTDIQTHILNPGLQIEADNVNPLSHPEIVQDNREQKSEGKRQMVVTSTFSFSHNVSICIL